MNSFAKKSLTSSPKHLSLRRTKSMQSLHIPDMEELSTALEKFHYDTTLNRSRLSESSIEITVINDTSDSDVEFSIDAEDEQRGTEDSDVCASGSYKQGADLLQVLEQKIDTLSYVFEEQSKLLASLKVNVKQTTAMVEKVAQEHHQITMEVIRLFGLTHRLDPETKSSQVANDMDTQEATSSLNFRAKALLDALVAKRKSQSSTIDGLIKTALSEFLESDALKERMLSATTESIQHVIEGSFTEDVTACYLPLLLKSHQQMQTKFTKILENTFKEMEENTLSFSRSSFKTSNFVRTALQRHQRLVENCTEPPGHLMTTLKHAVHNVIKSELLEWRGKITNILADTAAKETTVLKDQLNCTPRSPPQPVEPGRSAIEQLMSAAEINVRMKKDVNGSFERALSASDLSLVMAACRAADPDVVFSPCQLKQPVVLSLTQQLATDLVHDTQLKCRYLEDAIVNLDANNPVTRTHLPIVIGEVLKNLKTFLSTFPSHMSSRRIRMLIMAANSLLKDNAQIAMRVPN